MQSAPEDDPLRKFLSGKRRSERRACDIPVEVRGGGVSFVGRAIDVSDGGALIWLDDASLSSVHPGMGVIEALGVVDRYFSHGAQIVFPAESLLLPSSVVRLSPPAGGDGIQLGCRFERALTEDETARLVRPKPVVPLSPLAWMPRPHEDLFVYLFGKDAVTAGPLYIGRLVGLDDATADVRLEPVRPTKVEDVQDALTGELAATMMRAGAPVHQGPIKVIAVRPGISRTPAIDVRISSPVTFPASIRKRFIRRTV